jgi:hypothetical protein
MLNNLRTLRPPEKMEAAELKNLYQAIQAFREAMEEDLPLNDFDRVCLENYIALLQITYMEWKRRNSGPSGLKRAA